MSRGSSPLTRGKLETHGIRATPCGLIPAHAGKTPRLPSQALSRRAHPRSRGENQAFDPTANGDDGSSPLTRGKRDPIPERRARERLIPAHAGKTVTRLDCHQSFPAHPRSRGENELRELRDFHAQGSSPLTRGKLPGPRNRPAVGRLIPAHAGKTRHDPGRNNLVAAHPRSRGENEIARAEDVNGNGSSPLTRGKRWPRGWPTRRARLIPAHAGKTRSTPAPGTASQAHPRSRGENEEFVLEVPEDLGSSPLTRGKLTRRSRTTTRRRLIPAHAGKTRSRQSSATA